QPTVTAPPFPYTTLFRSLRVILAPMVETSKEPIGSMGTDVPLATLSDQSQHLSNYFKQLFAQVSNPPIDPIRERLVMSLNTSFGDRKSTRLNSSHVKISY